MKIRCDKGPKLSITELSFCVSKRLHASVSHINKIFANQNYNILFGSRIFCREVQYQMQPFSCQHREQIYFQNEL